MHAKMTRDRKKCFITTMERAIEELEKELICLRSSLSNGQDNSSSCHDSTNLPVVTPELSARPSPFYTSTSLDNGFGASSTDPLLLFHPAHESQPKKRSCHGFSLDV
jgi:hypothetical protein